MSDKKARKETIKKSPFCKDTVNKVLKEKHIFGDFLDGPIPRTRLSIYDKLPVEKKEQIRFTVSHNFCSVQWSKSKHSFSKIKF